MAASSVFASVSQNRDRSERRNLHVFLQFGNFFKRETNKDSSKDKVNRTGVNKKA